MQESNTKAVIGQGASSREALAFWSAHPLVASEWDRVLAGLPVEIEASARAWKALQRRRELQSGADLLRMVWAYTLCDWSLQLVGAWARVIGLGHMSGVAVRQRLRQAQGWLGHLVAACLLPRREGADRPGVRLRLVDATTVSRPGSVGTDWRVHVSWAMEAGWIDGLEVTDAHGGETLVRHPVRREDILVADRGYGHAKGIGSVLVGGGQLVVRIAWQNLPLETPEGQRVDLSAWLQSLPDTGVAECAVWVKTPQGRFPVRVVASPLTPAGAEAARRRARQAARKKGHTLDQRTVLAAGFILVVTNLPIETWSGEDVLKLYRLRWQVELVFKRLKGIWELGHLRAKTSALAQVYLLGTLLGALIAEGWTCQTVATWPDWWLDVDHPLSLWRVGSLWQGVLRQAVQGGMALSQVVACWPGLDRYLRDTPRRRPHQGATARVWWHQLRTDPYRLDPTSEDHVLALVA